MPGYRESGHLGHLRQIAASRPVRVAVLGDSNVAGSSNYGTWWMDMILKGNGRFLNWYYPETVGKTLPHEGYGISGLSLAGGLTHAVRKEVQESKADAMMVCLGANDVPASASAAWTTAQFNDVFDAFRTYAEMAAFSGKIVVCCRPLFSASKREDDMARLGDAIEGYARDNGLIVGPNVAKAIQEHTTAGDYTHDGTHLNGAGVAALGDVGAEWLSSLIPDVPAGSLFTRRIDASQAGILRLHDSDTDVWNGAGSGTPVGTFTEGAVAAGNEIVNGAWRVTKTAGEQVNISLANQAVTVGNWYWSSVRIKTTGFLAGGSYLQTDWKINGYHGGAYRVVNGIHDTNRWGLLHVLYKAGTGATTQQLAIYLRRVAGSGDSTCEIQLANPTLIDLTASGLAAPMGLA